jgi:hypothetical protein
MRRRREFGAEVEMIPASKLRETARTPRPWRWLSPHPKRAVGILACCDRCDTSFLIVDGGRMRRSQVIFAEIGLC